jgi:hypothetical protein
MGWPACSGLGRPRRSSAVAHLLCSGLRPRSDGLRTLKLRSARMRSRSFEAGSSIGSCGTSSPRNAGWQRNPRRSVFPAMRPVGPIKSAAVSRPLVEAMKPWLEMELGRIPGRGGLAEAIRYALSRWSAFAVSWMMAVSISTTIRSSLRFGPSRSGARIAGSDGGGARWATVCSLIATARLNDVEPFAYLKGVLERMTDGHPMSRLDELLPWNWPKTHVNH